MKGILRVRIMWTIRVCESRPSTNQPDWKSDWAASLSAAKTFHMITNIAMSKTELIGPMVTMKRKMPLESQLRGLRRYSSSIRSHGVASWAMS